MKKPLWLLLLLCAPGAMASSTEFSGNNLQQMCADGEPDANADRFKACTAYLADQVDTAVRYSMSVPASCVPFAIGPERLRQVWLKYAAAHPGELHRDASVLARAAMESEWPCKQGGMGMQRTHAQFSTV